MNRSTHKACSAAENSYPCSTVQSCIAATVHATLYSVSIGFAGDNILDRDEAAQQSKLLDIAIPVTDRHFECLRVLGR